LFPAINTDYNFAASHFARGGFLFACDAGGLRRITKDFCRKSAKKQLTRIK
jgi:hypothetical protein